MITSRDNETKRTAVYALQLGRALAGALFEFSPLQKSVEGAIWHEGLRALERGDILATNVPGFLSLLKATLTEHLDRHGPSYGALVFSGCSDDYPLADPDGERLRQIAELTKRFAGQRQDLIDLRQAESILLTATPRA